MAAAVKTKEVPAPKTIVRMFGTVDKYLNWVMHACATIGKKQNQQHILKEDVLCDIVASIVNKAFCECPRIPKHFVFDESMALRFAVRNLITKEGENEYRFRLYLRHMGPKNAIQMTVGHSHGVPADRAVLRFKQSLIPMERVALSRQMAPCMDRGYVSPEKICAWVVPALVTAIKWTHKKVIKGYGVRTIVMQTKQGLSALLTCRYKNGDHSFTIKLHFDMGMLFKQLPATFKLQQPFPNKQPHLLKKGQDMVHKIKQDFEKGILQVCLQVPLVHDKPLPRWYTDGSLMALSHRERTRKILKVGDPNLKKQNSAPGSASSARLNMNRLISRSRSRSSSSISSNHSRSSSVKLPARSKTMTNLPSKNKQSNGILLRSKPNTHLSRLDEHTMGLRSKTIGTTPHQKRSVNGTQNLRLNSRGQNMTRSKTIPLIMPTAKNIDLNINHPPPTRLSSINTNNNSNKVRANAANNRTYHGANSKFRTSEFHMVSVGLTKSSNKNQKQQPRKQQPQPQKKVLKPIQKPAKPNDALAKLNELLFGLWDNKEKKKEKKRSQYTSNAGHGMDRSKSDSVISRSSSRLSQQSENSSALASRSNSFTSLGTRLDTLAVITGSKPMERVLWGIDYGTIERIIYHNVRRQPSYRVIQEAFNLYRVISQCGARVVPVLNERTKRALGLWLYKECGGELHNSTEAFKCLLQLVSGCLCDEFCPSYCQPAINTFDPVDPLADYLGEKSQPTKQDGESKDNQESQQTKQDVDKQHDASNKSLDDDKNNDIDKSQQTKVDENSEAQQIGQDDLAAKWKLRFDEQHKNQTNANTPSVKNDKKDSNDSNDKKEGKLKFDTNQQKDQTDKNSVKTGKTSKDKSDSIWKKKAGTVAAINKLIRVIETDNVAEVLALIHIY